MLLHNVRGEVAKRCHRHLHQKHPILSLINQLIVTVCQKLRFCNNFPAIFILGKIVVFRCTFEIVVASLLIHGVRKVRSDF